MERSESVVTVKSKKDTKNPYLGKLFGKLKTVKNIEYIVAAVFIGILLLIFYSGGLFGTSGGNKDVEITLNDYAAAMESKLSGVLGSIDGAGKVRVMITYESGVELIPAETVSSQSNTVTDEYNGGYRQTISGSSQNSPVMVGGKPVILKEVQPKVLGVIVVAEGATSIRVKIELLKAVSTLLSVNQENIEIFAMTRR